MNAKTVVIEPFRPPAGHVTRLSPPATCATSLSAWRPLGASEEPVEARQSVSEDSSDLTPMLKPLPSFPPSKATVAAKSLTAALIPEEIDALTEEAVRAVREAKEFLTAPQWMREAEDAAERAANPFGEPPPEVAAHRRAQEARRSYARRPCQAGSELTRGLAGRIVSIDRLIAVGLAPEAAERVGFAFGVLRGVAFTLPTLKASGVSSPDDLEQIAAIKSAVAFMLTQPGPPILLVIGAGLDPLGWGAVRELMRSTGLLGMQESERAIGLGIEAIKILLSERERAPRKLLGN